jgi:DNA-binding PadR family transcriptional regulator
MAARRRVSNVLALAVLSALRQRPMHPYEMGLTLRSWGKDQDMGIKWGSLYTVVRNLAKHDLVEAMESNRQGARPERTVYRITEAGRAELVDWVRELVSTPQEENRPFTTGLSVISVLHPDDAMDLLGQRIDLLTADIAARRESISHYAGNVARLFLIEDEYEVAMREAELAWVRATLDELRSGGIPGLAEWAAWYGSGSGGGTTENTQ